MLLVIAIYKGDATNNRGLAGGIGAWEGSYVNITNCTVINNKAANFGAGLDFTRGFTITINGADILNNSSPTSGGAIYTYPQNILSLSNCLLNNNDAHQVWRGYLYRLC